MWRCPDALRHHLKLLPEFKDIDATDVARAVMLACHSMTTALRFCHATQDLQLARHLIDARPADLDGKIYEILSPLAEELDLNHPLQAVLVWRALVHFALTR